MADRNLIDQLKRYRRELTSLAYRAILAAFDDGQVQVAAHGANMPAADQEVIQADGLDLVQHYGVRTRPPKDTELVLLPTVDSDGECVIGENDEPPSGLPALGDKDVQWYTSSGQYVHLDDDGDMVLEPISGKDVLLGSGATKAIAVNGDSVYPTSSFATYLNNLYTAAYGSPPGTPITSATQIATVTASTTKAKAE